jgi:hypothetical protein
LVFSILESGRLGDYFGTTISTTKIINTINLFFVFLPLKEFFFVPTCQFSTVLLYQHSSPVFSKSFTPLLPACSVHYVLPHQYALPLFASGLPTYA